MNTSPGTSGETWKAAPDLRIRTVDEDLVATTLAAQRIATVVLSALGAEGVNLLNCSGAAAWQTVSHFHLHVIPRYHDRSRDRLELPFEPGRPADARAIARHAEILVAALRDAPPS